ncbi:MAG: cell division protein FtsL [Gammaproteobacteria bacterium]|nr:cell division protein FtsL [Gammaproteobacteria bacterium]MDH5613501.1 cell division protein FtsL [Gammaproteobacteria bacterium]
MQRAIFAFLIMSVLGSAVGIVYAKHQNRKLFVQLQTLQSERDAMNTEWGKLQLEQATWGTHGRIERFAHDKLHMSVPAAGEINMIVSKQGGSH